MSVLINNNSDDEPQECPLCLENFELDDYNFFPCRCGYQICRFCWNKIKTEGNGLCPACRSPYSENPADFKPLTMEELAKIKAEKRQKDQAKKQKISENRKHLANVRVVQKNLVFVVGLSPRLSDTEVLKKPEYFGKFGKIHKVVINTSTAYAGNQNQGPSASAYVTYVKSDDALRAIQAVNNIFIDGRTLKASLGTTKYCSHFMKNQQCPKHDCMYLHEMGDMNASFTKEDMQAGKHTDYERGLHEGLIRATEEAAAAAAAAAAASTSKTSSTTATSSRITGGQSASAVVASSQQQQQQQPRPPSAAEVASAAAAVAAATPRDGSTDGREKKSKGGNKKDKDGNSSSSAAAANGDSDHSKLVNNLLMKTGSSKNSSRTPSPNQTQTQLLHTDGLIDRQKHNDTPASTSSGLLPQPTAETNDDATVPLSRFSPSPSSAAAAATTATDTNGINGDSSHNSSSDSVAAVQQQQPEASTTNHHVTSSVLSGLGIFEDGEDDLGFDPFQETQKALAEMIESEQQEAQQVQANFLNTFNDQAHFLGGLLSNTNSGSSSSFGGLTSSNSTSTSQTQSRPPPGLAGLPNNANLANAGLAGLPNNANMANGSGGAGGSSNGPKAPPPGFSNNMNFNQRFGGAGPSFNGLGGQPQQQQRQQQPQGFEALFNGHQQHLAQQQQQHQLNQLLQHGNLNEFELSQLHHQQQQQQRALAAQQQQAEQKLRFGYPQHLRNLSGGSGNSSGGEQRPSTNGWPNKDWQDGLRALLPNVNVSFEQQQQQQRLPQLPGFPPRNILEQERLRQRQSWNSGGGGNNDWAGLDPAIVGGSMNNGQGQQGVNNSNNWMKSAMDQQTSALDGLFGGPQSKNSSNNGSSLLQGLTGLNLGGGLNSGLGNDRGAPPGMNGGGGLDIGSGLLGFGGLNATPNINLGMSRNSGSQNGWGGPSGSQMGGPSNNQTPPPGFGGPPGLTGFSGFGGLGSGGAAARGNDRGFFNGDSHQLESMIKDLV